MTQVGEVHTFRGPVPAADLGTTLIHEHVFVGHPELDLNLPHPEWDEAARSRPRSTASNGCAELGVRTVVDLTVPGLGRDVARVARVAERSPVHLVASTGCYAADVLPAYFQTHGPGLLRRRPGPAGRALPPRHRGRASPAPGCGPAMLKVVTDRPGSPPTYGG